MLKFLKNSNKSQVKIKAAFALVFELEPRVSFEGDPLAGFTALLFSVIKHHGAHELGFVWVKLNWEMWLSIILLENWHSAHGPDKN